MRHDSRLSAALHVLLHMSQLGRVVTSETLGPMMKTNPVVFRRTLAGLRKAGIVRSVKGHGGGWSLARDLRAVSLGDVYDALGMTRPFSMGHRDPAPTCLLEKAVNRAVGGALAEAEALLVSRLRGISVANLLEDARGRASPRQRKAWNSHA